MINRLSKREERIFYVCMVMIFVYVSGYWIVKPLLKISSDMESKASVVQKGIYKNLRINHKAQLLKEELGDYFDQFQQKQSNEEVMASLISQIENVSNDLSISISNLNPQKMTTDGYLNYFSISLRFNGEFEELMKFLYILQDQEHLFRVNEIKVNKTARRDTSSLDTHLLLSRVFIPQ